MSSELVRQILSKSLSKYLMNLSEETLSVALWSGYINFTNVLLNPSAFTHLPFDVCFGRIGRLCLSFPIKSFFIGIPSKIELTIDKIELYLKTLPSFEFFDYTSFDYKSKLIKQFTDKLLLILKLDENPQTNTTYTSKTIKYILDNIIVTIKDISLVLEDQCSNNLINSVIGIIIKDIKLEQKNKNKLLTINDLGSFVLTCRKNQKMVFNYDNINNINCDFIRDYCSMYGDDEGNSINYDINKCFVFSRIDLAVKISSEEENKFLIESSLDTISLRFSHENIIVFMGLINYINNYNISCINCYSLRVLSVNKPQKGVELFKHYANYFLKVIKSRKYGVIFNDSRDNMDLKEKKKIFDENFAEFYYNNKINDDIYNIIRYVDIEILESWVKGNIRKIYNYHEMNCFVGGLIGYFYPNNEENEEDELSDGDEKNTFYFRVEAQLKTFIFEMINKNKNEINVFHINEISVKFDAEKKKYSISINDILFDYVKTINKSQFKINILKFEKEKNNAFEFSFSNNNIISNVKPMVITYNQNAVNSLQRLFFFSGGEQLMSFEIKNKIINDLKKESIKKSKCSLLLVVENPKIMITDKTSKNSIILSVNEVKLSLNDKQNYALNFSNINLSYNEELLFHDLDLSFKMLSNKYQIQSSSVKGTVELSVIDSMYKILKEISSMNSRDIWQHQTKEKMMIYDNSIKRGFLMLKSSAQDKVDQYYSLLSGGYIYLFKNPENLTPSYLIGLSTSKVSEVYKKEGMFWCKISGEQNFSIGLPNENSINEWKKCINNRIDEINSSEETILTSNNFDNVRNDTFKGGFREVKDGTKALKKFFNRNYEDTFQKEATISLGDFELNVLTKNEIKVTLKAQGITGVSLIDKEVSYTELEIKLVCFTIGNVEFLKIERVRSTILNYEDNIINALKEKSQNEVVKRLISNEVQLYNFISSIKNNNINLEIDEISVKFSNIIIEKFNEFSEIFSAYKSYNKKNKNSNKKKNEANLLLTIARGVSLEIIEPEVSEFSFALLVNGFSLSLLSSRVEVMSKGILLKAKDTNLIYTKEGDIKIQYEINKDILNISIEADVKAIFSKASFVPLMKYIIKQKSKFPQSSSQNYQDKSALSLTIQTKNISIDYSINNFKRSFWYSLSVSEARFIQKEFGIKIKDITLVSNDNFIVAKSFTLNSANNNFQITPVMIYLRKEDYDNVFNIINSISEITTELSETVISPSLPQKNQANELVCNINTQLISFSFVFLDGTSILLNINDIAFASNSKEAFIKVNTCSLKLDDESILSAETEKFLIVKALHDEQHIIVNINPFNFVFLYTSFEKILSFFVLQPQQKKINLESNKSSAKNSQKISIFSTGTSLTVPDESPIKVTFNSFFSISENCSEVSITNFIISSKESPSLLQINSSTISMTSVAFQNHRVPFLKKSLYFSIYSIELFLTFPLAKKLNSKVNEILPYLKKKEEEVKSVEEEIYIPIDKQESIDIFCHINQAKFTFGKNIQSELITVQFDKTKFTSLANGELDKISLNSEISSNYYNKSLSVFEPFIESLPLGILCEKDDEIRNFSININKKVGINISYQGLITFRDIYYELKGQNENSEEIFDFKNAIYNYTGDDIIIENTKIHIKNGDHCNIESFTESEKEKLNEIIISNNYKVEIDSKSKYLYAKYVLKSHCSSNIIINDTIVLRNSKIIGIKEDKVNLSLNYSNPETFDLSAIKFSSEVSNDYLTFISKRKNNVTFIDIFPNVIIVNTTPLTMTFITGNQSMTVLQESTKEFYLNSQAFSKDLIVKFKYNNLSMTSYKFALSPSNQEKNQKIPNTSLPIKLNYAYVNKVLKIFIYFSNVVVNNTLYDINSNDCVIEFGKENSNLRFFPVRNFSNLKLNVDDRSNNIGSIDVVVLKENYAFYKEIGVTLGEKRETFILQRHVRYCKFVTVTAINIIVISPFSNYENDNEVEQNQQNQLNHQSGNKSLFPFNNLTLSIKEISISLIDQTEIGLASFVGISLDIKSLKNKDSPTQNAKVKFAIENIQLDNMSNKAIYKVVLSRIIQTIPLVCFVVTFTEKLSNITSLSFSFPALIVLLDSEFSSTLLSFLLKAKTQIFKTTKFTYSSITALISSLEVGNNRPIKQNQIITISNAQISPITLILSYKHITNALFDQLQIKSAIIQSVISIFANTTHVSFHFNPLTVGHIKGSIPSLQSRLIDYYYYALLKQGIRLIFSVDILGNPLRLINRVGKGVKDLIMNPLYGAINGPSTFLTGSYTGMKSLISNTIGGLCDSGMRISNGLSRTLLQLVNNDDEYYERREKLIRSKRKHVSNFLFLGLTGGIKDFFYIPYWYYQNRGITYFLNGSLLGVASLMAKPISGGMDAVSFVMGRISKRILLDDDIDIMRKKMNRRRTKRINRVDNKILPYDGFGELCSRIVDAFFDKIYESVGECDFKVDKFFIMRKCYKKLTLLSDYKVINNKFVYFISVINESNEMFYCICTLHDLKKKVLAINANNVLGISTSKSTIKEVYEINLILNEKTYTNTFTNVTLFVTDGFVYNALIKYISNNRKNEQ